jgi:hypothetical protein
MKMKYIAQLLQSKMTIFRADDIQLILGIKKIRTVREVINRCIKSGVLIKITNGINALQNYDPLELASKIKSPSYISLETVLQRE